MCGGEGKFAQVCGRDGCRTRLALDRDGNLWKAQVKFAVNVDWRGKSTEDANCRSDSAKSVDWQPVSFNENYAGYYPACTFTAIAATDVDFVAVGNGEDGLPYVYRSLMGGVWESANLMVGSTLNGFVRASGKINQMLYDHQTRQIFLLCDNGELVTMPDCPKCVRVRKVTDCALVAGRVEDESGAWNVSRAGRSGNVRYGASGPRLLLVNARSEEIILNAYEMTQVRASFTYVKEQLEQGGWLIDLRGKKRAGMSAGISPEQVLYMCMDEVVEWLEEQPEETFLAFLCEYGTQADEAAHYARRRHFPRAYSLGGAGELLHVK